MSIASMQAKIARERLHNMDPDRKQRYYTAVRDKVDLDRVPDHEVLTATHEGIGESGVKEIIVALGLWMLENEVTEFEPSF